MMGTEQKQLLVTDIGSRLPYKVKARVFSYWNDEYVDDYIIGIDTEEGDVLCSTIPGQRCEIERVKLYLFPLSSMTEEQKEDLLLTVVGEEGLKLFSVTNDGIVTKDKSEQSLKNFSLNSINFSNENIKAYIDWCNKNHLDYGGLIPMGLAIDATNLNIY